MLNPNGGLDSAYFYIKKSPFSAILICKNCANKNHRLDSAQKGGEKDMSNSAKNAKSIGLSVAGILVALPADADLASITWVERAIQNQTPIPAGSVITGYASGSYGSYLLAGSTVGGPYSGVSISEIGSQMSPYIQGSQIQFGYSDSAGDRILMTTYYNGTANSLGTGAAWVSLGELSNDIYTNQLQFYYAGNEATPYYLGGTNSNGNAFLHPTSALGKVINFPVASGGSMILAGNGGTGTAGWMSMNSLATTLGSLIGSKIPGSMITGIMGSNVKFNSVTSGNYVLMGSSSNGTGGWIPVSGASGHDLSDYLFLGAKTTDTPTYILGNGNGGSGTIPAYHSASQLGTLIGTVNGSQVKIEQTATAAELRAKTGTIYFPVVQDGKIYGVTLNDFYILMNAQF